MPLNRATRFKSGSLVGIGLNYICKTAANIVKHFDTSTIVSKKNLFGENLRKARKQSGMSQDALAQALGVGRTTIVNWENGTSTPTIDTLLDVSSVLNTTPNQLLLGTSTYLDKEQSRSDVLNEPPVQYGVVHRDNDVAHRDSQFTITVSLPELAELRKEVRLLRELITNQKPKS